MADLTPNAYDENVYQRPERETHTNELRDEAAIAWQLRAERLESAIREVGGRINLQVGTADDTYVIAVPASMLREWHQTFEVALAADPQPAERGDR